MPYDGVNVLILPDGWEGVQSTQGPMARSVDDLELYMQLMCDAKPWNKEPGVTVKPWVPSKGPGRKLKVGILRDNGVVAPVAAINRAIDTAVEKLKKAGEFEVVEYKPFESQRAWDIIVSVRMAENTEWDGEVVLRKGNANARRSRSTGPTEAPSSWSTSSARARRSARSPSGSLSRVATQAASSPPRSSSA